MVPLVRAERLLKKSFVMFVEDDKVGVLEFNFYFINNIKICMFKFYEILKAHFKFKFKCIRPYLIDQDL